MQSEVLKMTFQFHTEQNTSSWHSLLLTILIFEKETLTNKIKLSHGIYRQGGYEHKEYKEKNV